MRGLRSLLPLASLAALLGGCAGGGGTVPLGNGPLAGSSAFESQAAFFEPDACGSPVTEKVKPKGGVFDLPTCGGVTGKISYGPNGAAKGDSVALETYTSNPDPSACGSPEGETALLYGTVLFTSSTANTFQNAAKPSTLKDKSFVSGATYTLFAYLSGTEVLAESLGSPKKGVLAFTAPFDGATLPPGADICFELDTP